MPLVYKKIRNQSIGFRRKSTWRRR